MISELCAECRDSSSPFTMSFRSNPHSSPAPAQCAWRPRIIRSLACGALQCSAVVGAMPCMTAAPTLFGFAWQTPSFLSLLFSSLDFSAHSSASRIPRARRSKTFAASERREREGGRAEGDVHKKSTSSLRYSFRRRRRQSRGREGTCT